VGEVSAADKPTLFVYDEREPVWLSGARDAISFGGFIATAVALNRLIHPSAWLNAALAIAWILWLAGKGIKRRMTKTPSEARAWLDEQYPESQA
jgi:hypothetical protein